MTDELMESAEAETFDFSEDGLKTQDAVLTVTEFVVETKDNGIQHKLVLDTGGVVGYPINYTGWVKHTNPKAQEIGRGSLKRFATAALGQPKYNAENIVGARILAEIYEDDSGFAKIRKLREAPADVTAVS